MNVLKAWLSASILLFSIGMLGACDVRDTSPPAVNANLDDLRLMPGTLDQLFHRNLMLYTSTVDFMTTAVSVVATAEDPVGATITANGEVAPSGGESPLVPLEVGDNEIEIVVTAADGVTRRTYTVIVTRQSATDFAQEAYIKASNNTEGLRFGFSIALSGDTLAVGVPFEDSAATGIDGNQVSDCGAEAPANCASASGAVYVFTRIGETWSQEAYIKASNAFAGDQFGRSVALSGDTLVVGAPFEDSAATGIDGNQVSDCGAEGPANCANASGAVYVFTRSADVWAQQAYIKASNTGAGDQFGFSVAIDANTLAAGAVGENSADTGIDGNQADFSAVNSGAAYVFTRSAEVWTQEAYVKASNTRSENQFGHSVALSGEVLAVGAPYEDSAATGVNGDQASDCAAEPPVNCAFNSGAVYAFLRSGADWGQEAYLKPSNTGERDRFGWHIALSGNTLAVGAPFEDGAATGVDGDQASDCEGIAPENCAVDSGAAYVFSRDGGGWSQQAYVKASNTGAGDRFGRGVGLSGDNLVVGADHERSGATGIGGDQNDESALEGGAVYLYNRDGSEWSPLAYIKPSNTRTGILFGHSVTVSGDTMAIGAPFEDSSATGINGNDISDCEAPAPANCARDSGAVYVIR